MRHAAYAAVVLTAITGAYPATAGAETPTTSRMVHQFVTLGAQFWHDRGVYPCEQPIVIRADMGPDAHGAAIPGSCRIWVSTGLVTAAQRERWRPLAGGDSDREDLCTTIFHELGHTAGLALPVWDGTAWVDTHPESGLMSAQAPVVPWACHVWRLRADRAQRRALGRA